MGSQLRLGVAIAIASALILCACGGKSSTSTSPTSSTTVTVNIVGSIGNQAYKPNPIAAATGYTVVFKNNDTAVHHIVLDDGSADLGDLAPGATSNGFSVKNSNQLLFHCKNHPSMVGSVNGQTAPDPPPCPDPYGYGC
jgi:plastocyanin